MVAMDSWAVDEGLLLKRGSQGDGHSSFKGVAREDPLETFAKGQLCGKSFQALDVRKRAGSCRTGEELGASFCAWPGGAGRVGMRPTSGKSFHRQKSHHRLLSSAV